MMDVVGVMYNRETGRVRFSLNGIQLPPACHTPGRLYYPVRFLDLFDDHSHMYVLCVGMTRVRVSHGHRDVEM
jgi:hypothetical protein